MNLDFTEEQDMLRETVRGVCNELCPTDVVRSMEDDPKGYPDDLWKQFAELGITGIVIPEQYGGSDMGIMEAAIAYEEMGRAVCPTPHFHSAFLSAKVLLASGSEDQKSEWLPKIANGDSVLTPAWIEPHNLEIDSDLVETAREEEPESLQQKMENFERLIILGALNRNKGNISKTAEELALTRSGLHKKIARLQIGKDTRLS